MKWALVILSFGIFGILGVYSSVEEPGASHMILGLLIALIMAGISIGSNVSLFSALNPDIREKYGVKGIADGVLDGYLYMLPFLTLAGFSVLLFKWDVPMAFASAAVMIGGATAGTEMMKRGAKGIKNMLIPSGIGFAVTLLWMTLLSALARI